MKRLIYILISTVLLTGCGVTKHSTKYSLEQTDIEMLAETVDTTRVEKEVREEAAVSSTDERTRTETHITEQETYEETTTEEETPDGTKRKTTVRKGVVNKEASIKEEQYRHSMDSLRQVVFHLDSLNSALKSQKYSASESKEKNTEKKPSVPFALGAFVLGIVAGVVAFVAFWTEARKRKNRTGS